MSETIRKRIEELNSELSQLREERDKQNLEARKWAEKRDALHEEIKKLRKEIGGLKEKRDGLNEKVQELKSLREKAKLKRKEKYAQIMKIKEKIEVLKKKKPSRSTQDIKKEIENLEWKIQTTAYTLKEEKLLTDQVSVLEAQLLIHEQMQELEKTLLELQAEDKALQTKAKTHHERLSQFAEQSQNFHQQMLETSKRAQSLQVEADGAHQKYLENKQQARDLNQKCKQLLDNIKTMRKEIHEVEEKKRVKRETELRKELEEKALEKLKRGQKLTWEEFKVLSEKGMI